MPQERQAELSGGNRFSMQKLLKLWPRTVTSCDDTTEKPRRSKNGLPVMLAFVNKPSTRCARAAASTAASNDVATPIRWCAA